MSTTYNNAVGPHVRASQPVIHQCRDSGDRTKGAAGAS